MQPHKTFNQIYLLGRNTRAKLSILVNSFQGWDLWKKKPKQVARWCGKKVLCFYDTQLSQSHEEYFNRLLQTKSQAGAKCFHKTFATVCTKGWWHLLTLMGITIGCREGLKYLQAFWGQVHVQTLSLTHTYTCTHLHTTNGSMGRTWIL